MTLRPIRAFPEPKTMSAATRRCFALLALLWNLVAVAQNITAPEMRWHLPEGQRIAAASLALDVGVEIHGLVAEARVTQSFRNEGAAFLSGEYLLPLPEGATVHTLRVRIGQRLIEGEVREKEQARAEFDAAAAAGQRTGLVEQQRANLFRTAVANVAPGETVEVEVGYWQKVAYRDGTFELVFPLTFVAPYSQGLAAGARPVSAPPVAATQAGAPPTVKLAIALEPGLPLRSVESATHAVAIARKGTRYDVTLATSTVPPDRDFVLRWRPEPGREPAAAVFVERGAGADYVLAMLVPPEQRIETLPRELILVIDTSGSMLGPSMEQAKAALDAGLARLKPGDRFNVIQFNSYTSALFEAPVQASAQRVAEARAWVAQLQADGGTEMLPALDAALQGAAASGHVRQVVFATDGAVTDEDGLYTLIEDALGDTRLFPVGIGDAPNARFLSQAARMGRGASVVIRDLGEVATRMEELFAKLDRPALRDVALAWPGIADAYPPVLPDLYQGEPLLVVAKLDRASGKLDASGIASGGGWSKSLALPARNDRGIARLWARGKIEALEDELRRGAEEALIRPQVVEVALAHHLVTRYTSLVAIDRTPVRPANAPVDGIAFANGGSGDLLAFAQGATPAPLLAWLGAFGLLAMALASRRRIAWSIVR